NRGGLFRSRALFDSIRRASQQFVGLFPPPPRHSFLTNLVSVLTGLDVVGFATQETGVDLRKPYDATPATPLPVRHLNWKYPDPRRDILEVAAIGAYHRPGDFL